MNGAFISSLRRIATVTVLIPTLFLCNSVAIYLC